MKEVKKSPAKKAVAKAAPAPKPVAKPAPKAAVAKPAAKKSSITPEQRYKMIEETAYFIAERHGFSGDSAYFWSLAEADVNNRLN